MSTAQPERRLLIEAMLLMVAADGRIHDDEILQLGEAISQHAIFAEDDIDSVIDVLRDVFKRLAADGFDARLQALSDGLDSYRSRLLAFALATRISFADGDLDQAELDLLRTFQAVFGLREIHVQKVVEAVSVGSLDTLDALVDELWQRERDSTLANEEALIEVMLIMAAADGEEQGEEATQLALTIANNERFQSLSENDIAVAVRGALDRIQSDGMSSRLAELKKVLVSMEDRVVAVRFAYQILAADGVLAPSERECLRQMQLAFELEDQQMLL